MKNKMKRLIWSREQPTEPGWYWKRRDKKYKRDLKEKDEIVYIRNYCGELCIGNWTIPVEDIEWAGPILKPKILKKKKEKEKGEKDENKSRK